MVSRAEKDAGRVAAELGIPFHAVHFEDAFKQNVVDYFVREYIQGRTPNPCIVCNRQIKWGELFLYAKENGADFIATGHYAGVVKRENGRYAVSASKTSKKDQTYALFALTQEQLAHTLMPTGEYTKEEIRAIAKKIGLRVADKPDSQEICFIPDHDYAGFIGRMAGDQAPGSGNFVAKDGTLLGRHKGITHYTIGQRKGLNLAMGRPVFVSEIRPTTNEVVIGEAGDVYASELVVDQVCYMGVPQVKDGQRFLTKIRYAHPGAMAAVFHETDGRLRFVFDEPQRAITPGQAAVFYDGGCVAGGGMIVS